MNTTEQLAKGSKVVASFACRAIYEMDRELLNPRTGKPARMLVHATGTDIKPPMLNGMPVNCLYRCPATVKSSGRKEQMAWVGEEAVKPEGALRRCVTCRPVRLERM